MVRRLLLCVALVLSLSTQIVLAQEETGDDAAAGNDEVVSGGGPTFSLHLIVLFPEMPAMPGMPDIPGGMPNLEDIPGGMPEMPDIPDGMPDMPDIPGGMPNMLGALSQGAQLIPPMPRTGSDDPCAAPESGAQDSGEADQAGSGGAPGDLSALPPLPKALMMVLLTNNSDETQSYMITASSRSSGAVIGTSIAPFVGPGKSTIPMFVLQSDPPQPEDVDFSAQLTSIDVPPCLNDGIVHARVDLGAPTLDGMDVSVPVTNQDPDDYSVMVQVGLLQGDQLVAVGMESVSVPGEGSSTALVPLSFPFDIEEPPAHNRIVPGLGPFGVQPASE